MALGIGGRLCAICVARPAELLDEIDDMTYPVCTGCSRRRVPTPPKEMAQQERVLRALGRMPGADIVELAQALGEDDKMGRARVSAVLARAIKAGLVTYIGGRMDRLYTLALQTSATQPAPAPLP